MSNTTVYHLHVPTIDKCALCDSRHGPFILEHRPTGKNFTLQTWSFCRQCWVSLKAERQNQDPELCCRWLVFSKWLAGAYPGLELPADPEEEKMIDSDDYMIISSTHEEITNEHFGRTSQEAQTILCRNRPADDGVCFETYRGALDEDREETEITTRMEAGPVTAPTATGP